MSIDLGAGVRQYDVAGFLRVCYPAGMPTLWALVYLAAGAAGAEEVYDYKTVEFWSKSYRIDEYASRYRVVVAAGADIDDMLQRTKAWMLARGGSGEDGQNWLIPPASAAKTVRRLLEEFPVTSVTELTSPGGATRADVAELRYKQKMIRAELATLPSAPAYPALRGLSEAQLENVDRLLAAADAAAARALVSIAVADRASNRVVREALTVPPSSEYLMHGAPRAQPYWHRMPLPSSCFAAGPGLYVKVRAVKPASAQDALRRWVGRHARERDRKDCPSGAAAVRGDTSVVMVPFLLADGKRDALRRHVMTVGELLEWHVLGAEPASNPALAAVDKRALLQADLADGAAERAVPHISALARAEAARLAPLAEAAAAMRGYSVVTLRVEHDRGGHP